MDIEEIMFPSSDWVPNNLRLPVLVYKRAGRAAAASSFEALFADNGWTGVWRNGVFGYQHYHSGAHEILGIGQGAATLLIGGPGGRALQVSCGDCLLLPAGTGHQNLKSSPDFEVVGAYPHGQQADIQITAPTPDILTKISRLPVPDTDPVLGASDGLVRRWKT
jgi:uncharacterized protein YjlB